jgi:hypothetical protein
MSKAVPIISPTSENCPELSPGQVADPFAFAGHCFLDHGDAPAGDGDARVLALFREWIDASRATDRHDNDEDRTEHDAAVHRCDKIEAEIIASTGGAVVGDIKLYFFLHHLWLMDEKGPDVALLRYDPDSNDWDQQTEDFMLSLLRDAARRVPEIAELAAPILGMKP